jgi:citrate lyase gamma subunit
MEEISDRIVLKVISGIQSEAGRGSPLVSHIQQQVLHPRRQMISHWLSARVAKAAAESYVPNRGALRNYLEARVDHALQQNIELSRLKLLPVVGETIAHTLEDSVGDIVANIVHQILEDLASSANHAFIDDLVAAALPNGESGHKGHQANQALIEMIQEILEAVKTQVKVKRWRENLP